MSRFRPGRRAAGLLLCLSLLGGCAAPQSAALLRDRAAATPVALLLSDIPFHAQERYQCGPAALAMALGASRASVSPEELVPLVYVPARKGSFQVEMVAAARSHGRLVYELQPSLADLLAELRAGHPVLVLQNLGLSALPQWHFALAKGYDLARRKLILNSGLEENYEMDLKTFERTWSRAEHWAILVLEPGQIPASALPAPYFRALADLEDRAPANLEKKAARDQLELAYRRGLERWPEDSNLRMGYGNLLYAQERLDAAAREFRALTERHPDYAPAYNNLAQVLFEMGQLEEAAQLAEIAVQLGGDYLDSYRQTLAMIRSFTLSPR